MNAYQNIINSIYLNDTDQLNAAIEQTKKEKLKIARSEEGEGKLFSALIRLVNSQWLEGWEIIYTNFKPLLLSRKEGEFPLLWPIAIMNGNIKVLRDLENLGYILKYKDDEQKSSVHLLFDTLGIHKIHKPNNAKLLEMINWFKENIDIYESYPGRFNEKDTLKNGHALWNYAIKQDNWEIALHTIPETWKDLNKTPRWQESIIYLQEMVNKESENDIYMQKLWNKILVLFGEQKYVQEIIKIKNLKSLNYLVISMENKNRDFLWEIINEVNPDGRNFWHQILGQPNTKLFYDIIQYAITDKINVQPLITQKDRWTERPIDSYAMFWEVTEEKKEEKDINYYNFLLNNLNKKDLLFTSELITSPLVEKLL